MGDQTVGDEVVGAFDVEVVHREIEIHPLDRLDYVVVARFVEHRHARPNRRGMDKRECVHLTLRRPRETTDVPNADVHGLLDAIDELHQSRVVHEVAFSPPSLSARARGLDIHAQLREFLARCIVSTADSHRVHRRTVPRPGGTKRDHHLAST